MHCDHPPARTFPSPLVREMLRALGIETCSHCRQVVRIHARGRTWLREDRPPR